MPKIRRLIVLLDILGLILVSITIFIIWYIHNGWWVRNPDKNDRPTAVECIKDFKEGVTTIQNLKEVLGEPSRIELLGGYCHLNIV